MNPREFLSQARRLASLSTPVDWRTAASRAYYALFHVARQLLLDLGFVVPRDDKAHSHLRYRLQNCGAPAIEQVGRDVDQLRTLRNQADYDLHIAMSQVNVLDSVDLAEQGIVCLDTVVEPARSQIRDGMKIYERDVLQNVTWRP
jgi:uncharacterized protein (UPF0332 family)